MKIGIIILLILSVVTFLTVKHHPQLHNPMIIEDANFEIVEVDDSIEPTASVAPAQKPVERIEVVETSQIADTKNIVNEKPKTQTKIVQVKEIQSQPKNIEVKTSSNPNNKSHTELIQKVLDNAQKAQLSNQDIIKKETKVSSPTNEQKTQTVKIQPQETDTKVIKIEQPVKTSSNPYMTEEEEIIAWNKWRSDIQNQIMKDSNIGNAYYGTVFSFSFIVDKFGNISNIKVSSNPTSYMDIAKNGVKPAIANLQNKPILNFPKGTRRTTTVFNGKFVISTYNKYSTPNEYSDYERIVH